MFVLLTVIALLPVVPSILHTVQHGVLIVTYILRFVRAGVNRVRVFIFLVLIMKTIALDINHVVCKPHRCVMVGSIIAPQPVAATALRIIER